MFGRSQVGVAGVSSPARGGASAEETGSLTPPPKPEVDAALLANLQRRFPDKTEAEIARVVEQCGGHAGQAARFLKGNGAPKVGSDIVAVGDEDGGQPGPGGGFGGGGLAAADDDRDWDELTEEERQQRMEEELGGMDMFDTKRPKHLLSGTLSAARSILKGVAAGAFALLALPIEGAISEGGKGFAKGLGAGVVSGVGLPVAASVVGAVQIGRGLLNTPQAVIAEYRGHDWDREERKWVAHVPFNLAEHAGATST